MKSNKSPNEQREFVRCFRTPGSVLSFTGPGKRHPSLGMLLPNGFGKIEFDNDNRLTWAEVTTLVKPHGKIELIYNGLRYDIIHTPILFNRCRTELRISTHQSDGLLLETLSLFYDYPTGYWSLATLVKCEISQPSYTKTQAGCWIFKALQDPVHSIDKEIFFRKTKHSLVIFDQRLYFVNRHYRTIRCIARDENNSVRYDAILSECVSSLNKKPTKMEINQGYVNPYEATKSLCDEMSLLVACSLDEGVLNDGEGVLYDITDNGTSCYIMGPIACNNPLLATKPGDYQLLRSRASEDFFYSGKAIVIDEHHLSFFDNGICYVKTRTEHEEAIIRYQGGFYNNRRHGAGVALVTERPINQTLTLGNTNEAVWLEEGAWVENNRHGEFILTDVNKKTMGVIYCEDVRQPVPFVCKENGQFCVVGFDEDATFEMIGYIALLSQTSMPVFLKVVDYRTKTTLTIDVAPFFQEIVHTPHYHLFLLLLLRHSSYLTISYIDKVLRVADVNQLANDLYSSGCGFISFFDEADVQWIDTNSLSKDILLSLLNQMVTYLSSCAGHSKLFNYAVLLQSFFNKLTIEDEALILSYDLHLLFKWSGILESKKTIAQREKRALLEALVCEYALRWIFTRTYLMLTAIEEFKSSQSLSLTSEEQAVFETFVEMKHQISIARHQKAQDLLTEVEQQFRESIAALADSNFKYFENTVSISKHYVEQRAVLFRELKEEYTRDWQEQLDRLDRENVQQRVALKAAYSQLLSGMKPAYKQLHVLNACVQEEGLKRHKLLIQAMSAFHDVHQEFQALLTQLQSVCIEEEIAQRASLIALAHHDFNMLHQQLIQSSRHLISQLDLFQSEYQMRQVNMLEVNQQWVKCKIHAQLEYIIRYVSRLPFDRPFDVYIVGSAVANKCLGRDWHDGQDIDLMLVARSPGEFLQMSESNVMQSGLRISQHIYGLYTGMINVPGIGYRRIDLKVSDQPPSMDYLRRDFTVGALYENGGSLVIDPSQQGLNDLRTKQLNTVISAVDSFSECPVRMLRAIKYLLNGYTLSDDIVAAMKKWSGRLTPFQKNHMCAVVRTHLATLDNQLYIKALMDYDLTTTLFNLPSGLSDVDLLRGLNHIAFHQTQFHSTFFSKPKCVQAAEAQMHMCSERSNHARY